MRWSLTILLFMQFVAAAAAAEPRRIASCSLASDETLLSLLADAHQLQRLVAVSTLADDPRYSNVAGQIPKSVSGRCGGELESLLALHPDLAVLASFNRPEMRARLAAAGVQTYVVEAFDTLDDIEANTRALGRVAGLAAVAAAEVATFQAARAEIQAEAPARRPTVLEFFPDGTVSGKATLFEALTRAAGGVDLAAAKGWTGWPKISAEVLATLRPDLIVIGGAPADRDALLAKARETPGWREMPAVRDGRLVVIPEAELGATSLHILTALRRLHAAVLAAAGVATPAPVLKTPPPKNHGPPMQKPAKEGAGDRASPLSRHAAVAPAGPSILGLWAADVAAHQTGLRGPVPAAETGPGSPEPGRQRTGTGPSGRLPSPDAGCRTSSSPRLQPRGGLGAASSTAAAQGAAAPAALSIRAAAPAPAAAPSNRAEPI